MSKIQDVPFITKVIDTLSDELKSGLYDLIDGQVKTPIFRSLVNNDYAITEANDKGKVQFVTLETLRGNYTGYLAYNSVYCVLIAFKGNTQALDMLNINVAKHTFAFVNESLSILELRVELEDGKKGVTPTDLGVTNNNIHLAKGTKQIGEGINLKTLDGNTLIGSGNVGFKTINDQEIVGDGNIVVGEGGTIAIDTAFDETSTNAVQNKVIAKFANEVVENKANVDGNYPTMTVGNADNANNLIATKGLEVESYFTFGKTGGEQASAIETGNGTLKNLYGKTLVWNQLLQNGNFGDTSRWYGSGATFSISNNVATFIATELYGGLQYDIQLQTHKYLLGCSLKSSVATDQLRLLMTDRQRNYSVPAQSNTNEQTLLVLANVSNATSSGYIKIQDNRTSDWTSVDVKNVILIDLTQMFGAGNEPTSIDDYRAQWAISYAQLHLEYNSGQIVHTHINGLKSTGINQWDEETEQGSIDSTGNNVDSTTSFRSKNFISIKPNENYMLHYGSYSSSSVIYYYFYDSNKNFISSNLTLSENQAFTAPALSCYMKIRSGGSNTQNTYNHDICINFSNPNINGNYYPYEEETLNIDFEGNGVRNIRDELNVEEKKKYQRFGIVDLGTLNWDYLDINNLPTFTALLSLAKPTRDNTKVSNLLTSNYTTVSPDSNYLGGDKVISLSGVGSNSIRVKDSNYTDAQAFKTAMSGVLLVYELATPIVTDIEIPNDTIKVWNGGSMEALGTEVPVGTKIFYQKNIKAFVESFGEAIDWNPERIERLAKLSITPEYVNISLNPSQANAYAVAQVYNATFTIVISTALTGTPNGEITFQDSEIDLSSFETQPAESIYDMDGKKVSEEPTTTDCNIASFVGRSYNGIVLWSLLHSGVNKVKVHFEQTIPLDSEGNGKLDCRASLIL